MGVYSYQPLVNGVKKQGTDVGLIASGSISFAATDNKTLEKKTDEITLGDNFIHPDGIFLLAVQKPAYDAVGDLTINTYNVIKIDNTNKVDTLHSTHTVEMISGSATYKDFVIQGLFVGEGSIKIGAKFDANNETNAITINFKIYRL